MTVVTIGLWVCVTSGVGALECAADCLKRGADAAAVPHLTRYVRTHPEHTAMRAHLAELLYRQGQHPAAEFHFARYLAKPVLPTDTAQRIHCHSRLMTIAQARGAEAEARLQRGIGLYWLGCVQAEPDAAGAEATWCKAVAALTQAEHAQRTSARVQVYLAKAWAALGQTHPAERHRRRAEQLSSDPDLTPDERAWVLEPPFSR